MGYFGALRKQQGKEVTSIQQTTNAHTVASHASETPDTTFNHSWHMRQCLPRLVRRPYITYIIYGAAGGLCLCSWAAPPPPTELHVAAVRPRKDITTGISDKRPRAEPCLASNAIDVAPTRLEAVNSSSFNSSPPGVAGS
eukprot:GHVU01199517.1.p1 GENE.GHVU01199517.1~~GHVU01199517.1.p1  ORF type:complete len:140 (-),score=4.09 GHVU01199517.1:485-904(-)